MPTNRPFLSNFLAAFRAHSALQQGKGPSPSTNTQTHTTSSTTTHSSSNSSSTPRTITTSTKPGATTTALTSLHSPHTHSTSPLSRSPGTDPSSPNSSKGGIGGGVNSPTGQQRYMTSSRGRRGSDDSSEGFRDVLGAEKWYIGGRTATGEERYFKLGVVRRRRSGGSLSLDRLSL